MKESFQKYINGNTLLPENNRLWPLYGSGLEHLGRDHKPIEEPMPKFGPDDLLIRHDSCSLCYSDVKVIRQGRSHPRILHNMKKQPVILGHEVSITVVGVGENLREEYQIGDRLTLQPDIFIDGVGQAYGYAFQGGLSRYNVIPPKIRLTDYGNMLIPLPGNIGYAEASLIEPWACVLAAYQLNYRTHIKSGGCLWIIGEKADQHIDFTNALRESLPDVIYTTVISQCTKSDLLDLQKDYNFNLTNVENLNEIPDASVDDIVLLTPTAQLIEAASPKLADHGIMALCTDRPLDHDPHIDIGRIHYQRWLYIAGSSNNIAEVYAQTPVRARLKPGGRAWFAGSGGPIGRMHVQHAIHAKTPPSQILCTDINQDRLDALFSTFCQEAQNLGIKFICLNPNKKAEYHAKMSEFKSLGFDDIIILAPVTDLVSEGSGYLAAEGVMNIFAGIRRGEKAPVDFDPLIKNQARFIGHSGSKLDDMRSVLDQWKKGSLSTNRTVAAIGSLSAAGEGYRALMEGRFTGKVVIYPHIRPFPLTGLPELKEKCPTVYEKLSPEGHWTNKAEAEFLNLMLP